MLSENCVGKNCPFYSFCVNICGRILPCGVFIDSREKSVNDIKAHLAAMATVIENRGQQGLLISWSVIVRALRKLSI